MAVNISTYSTLVCILPLGLDIYKQNSVACDPRPVLFLTLGRTDERWGVCGGVYIVPGPNLKKLSLGANAGEMEISWDLRECLPLLCEDWHSYCV